MEHPHVSMIRASARQFATGQLSVAHLQLSLSSVESAIEGDMLHANTLRALLQQVQNEIERAWFTLDEPPAVVHSNQVLVRLTAALAALGVAT